jgi:rare lipoprotein A (peptidoglycan hydrolase)
MKIRFSRIVLALPAFLSLSCSSLTMAGKPAEEVIAAPKEICPHPGYVKTERIYAGKASFYSIRCNGGTQTASGEKLSDYAHTAAHKTLPMGSKVLVTNKNNGKSVVVRINDRGPFIKGRVIDVTKGVAETLGMVKAGVVPCEVIVLQPEPVAEASTEGQDSTGKTVAKPVTGKS